MKIIRLSIIVGVFVFLSTLFFQLPAALVLSYVQPDMPLKLHNVKGSLWSGSAGSAYYKNIQLGSLDWKLKPLGLFTGRVAAYVELEGDGLSFLGDVAVNLRQEVYLKDSSLQMDAEWVEKFKPLPIQIDGVLMGIIHHANFDLKDRQKMPLIEGVINWKEGQTLKPIQIPPGNYQVKLLPEEGIQHIELSSEQAPIDLSGTVDLKSDGSYKPDLHFKATESANQGIRNVLALLGKPDNEGLYHFRQSGHLQQFLH